MRSKCFECDTYETCTVPFSLNGCDAFKPKEPKEPKEKKKSRLSFIDKAKIVTYLLEKKDTFKEKRLKEIEHLIKADLQVTYVKENLHRLLKSMKIEYKNKEKLNQEKMQKIKMVENNKEPLSIVIKHLVNLYHEVGIPVPKDLKEIICK